MQGMVTLCPCFALLEGEIKSVIFWCSYKNSKEQGRELNWWQK